MSDFFDELHAQLIDAARVRQAERRSASLIRRGGADQARLIRWWPVRRGRTWLLMLVAGVLIAAGTALAAVSIVGEQSKPLSGVVPPGQQPHTALVAGQRYTIGFAPSIQAGQIGWCVSTRTFSRSGRVTYGGTGGCNTPAPTTGAPVLGTQTIDNGGGQSYVFTTPSVAAIRIAGGPTVLTRPSARLPDGYRAAVFQYTPPKGQVGLMRIPGGAAHLITPLSSSDQPIAQDSSGPPIEPTRSWLYPHAPAAGVCSLAARAGTALRTGSGSVVTAAIAAPTITGAAFLPCINEDLYLPAHPSQPDASAGLGTYLVGAILLDAAHPGRPPAQLPSMHLIPESNGIYDSPSADVFAGNSNNGLTAKRIAGAWVVVAGGTGAAQRTTALDDLIPDVHLARSVAPVSPPPWRALPDHLLRDQRPTGDHARRNHHHPQGRSLGRRRSGARAACAHGRLRQAAPRRGRPSRCARRHRLRSGGDQPAPASQLRGDPGRQRPVRPVVRPGHLLLPPALADDRDDGPRHPRLSRPARPRALQPRGRGRAARPHPRDRTGARPPRRVHGSSDPVLSPRRDHQADRQVVARDPRRRQPQTATTPP